MKSVYVTGLPLDVTFEEVTEFFKKAGAIAKDPYNQMKPKIKLYLDDLGNPKGDALVTFLKTLAVASAFEILHEADFRPPTKCIVKLHLPEYEKKDNGNKRRRLSKKQKKWDQEKEELGWEEKEQVHVIVKGMFDINDPATLHYNFYENLKKEVQIEFEKMGPVASIKVFDRNPDGVVAVKYTNEHSANRCISVMNGRFFDKRQLHASFYDGFTNYFVEETEQELEKRDELWNQWLEGNSEYKERKQKEAQAEEIKINRDDKTQSSGDSDEDYPSDEAKAK